MALLVSSASAPASATPTYTEWWLKDPMDVTLNMTLHLEGEAVESSREEDQGLFYPLDDPAPVIASGQLRPEVVALSVFCPDAATEASLVALRETQRVLLLQAPTGEQWYGKFGPSWVRRRSGLGTPWRRIETEFRGTAMPPVV